MAPVAEREKIAILGGGIGALTAAFELTKVPGWQDKYEISVYQQGWRLGGKGASARDPNRHWRIEEHGPHVWFGFYFNAFALIAEAYRYCVTNGLLPSGSFATWNDAFSAKDNAVVLDYNREQWLWWNLKLPLRPGTPVDPVENDFWTLVDTALSFLSERLRLIQARVPAPSRLDPTRGLIAGVLLGAHRMAARIVRKRSSLTTLQPEAPIESLSGVMKIASDRMKHRDSSWLGRFALFIVRYLLGQLQKLIHSAIKDLLDVEDEIRHAWQILDIGLSALRGILADGVLLQGFDAIERIDFSHWLEKNGCSDAWSPLIRSIYDSGAHYEHGDTASSSPLKRPASANLAAGTALQCILRMFAGYCGSYSYRMNAGMGETVFTPIYLALQHRGVKFVFFSRVRRLRLNESKDAVAAVDLDVQATVTAGPLSYQPLLDPFHGLRCWPNHPQFEQLAEGSEIEAKGIDLESSWCDYHVSKQTLRVGPNLDFQKIVLGISVASLPSICEELSKASSAWENMLQKIKTVQTQFCQIWLKCPTKDLNRADTPTLTVEGFIEPIDTWLDMSQVLQKEGWPDPQGSVQYFVGPLADSSDPPGPAFPDQQRIRVLNDFRAFFTEQILKLWPLACVPGHSAQFDWELMRAPDGVNGWERLQHQYIRANVDPAERYVLSVAGSKGFRLRSDASGFANLFLAGDWTLNGIDAGSVEAAVMSGMQASQGMSGYPITILGGWTEMDRPSPHAPDSQGRKAGVSPHA